MVDVRWLRNGGLHYIAIVPNMHAGRDNFKLEVRFSAFYLKRVLYYYSANMEGDRSFRSDYAKFC